MGQRAVTPPVDVSAALWFTSLKDGQQLAGFTMFKAGLDQVV